MFKSSSKLINLFIKFSAGTWVAAFISFFSTPIITALILPEEFGKASMFTLAYNLVLQITLFGFDQAYVRMFNTKQYLNQKNQLLQNAIIIPIFIFVLLSFVLIIWRHSISILLINNYDIKIIIALIIITFLGIVDRFSSLFLRMEKKAFLYSIIRILGALIFFLTTVIYCYEFRKDFFAIIIGTILSVFITSTVGVILTKSIWFFKVEIKKKIIWNMFIYGVAFVPTFIISWFFEGIDKIALRNYSSFTEIGIFTAGYKIVAVLTILQTGFSTFWTPIAYDTYENQKDSLLYEKAFNWLSVVFFMLSIIIISSKDIVIMIFDRSYVQAAAVVPFLILYPIMYTLSEVTVGGINFKNKTYWHVVIVIISAVINLIGNIILVPHLGAKGAAISTGISYVIFFYLRTFISLKLFHIKLDLKRFNISLSLILFMCFCNTFMTHVLTLTIINLSVFILIYISYKSDIYEIKNKLFSREFSSLNNL